MFGCLCVLQGDLRHGRGSGGKKAGTDSLKVDGVAKVLCLAADFPAGAVVGWACALVNGHSVDDVHEKMMSDVD